MLPQIQQIHCWIFWTWKTKDTAMSPLVPGIQEYDWSVFFRPGCGTSVTGYTQSHVPSWEVMKNLHLRLYFTIDLKIFTNTGMHTHTETHIFSLLALVRGVCADRVVSYKLGFGSCTRVLWCVSYFVQWGVLLYWGRGGGMTEGAGPPAESLRLSIRRWRGVERGWGNRGVKTLQVPCGVVASDDMTSKDAK